MKEKLLSTKEIEKLFGITKQTAMRWRKTGVLPYIKMNSRVYLYKEIDIENILKGESNDY